MSKQFAVIGMGRVGTSLVKTLDTLGHDYLGIDCDEERIQDLAAELPGASLVAADATEGTVLRDLGLESFDGAAVVVGNNDQVSVLVTLILKDLKVPVVFARASSVLHARVLERVGADHVVQPEREFGEALAHRISSPGIQDYLDLGADEALVRMTAPEEWVGKTLKELRLPEKSGVEVVTIRSAGRRDTIPPHPDLPLERGDLLVVGGPKRLLDELQELD
jgi:trk system potassium uptake protein TrkA